MGEWLRYLAPYSVTALLTFVAAHYWFRKNRGVKREDDATAVTRLETSALAETLDEQRRLLAENLEAVRAEKAALLAEAQAAFGARFDVFEQLIIERLAGIDQRIALIEQHMRPLIEGVERVISEGMIKAMK